MEKNKTRELSQMAILTAILFMGQVVLSFLPNVEIVSLLIILYTLFLRKNVFFVIYSFVFLEGFLYGFGIWWFSYLYIWSLLACIVLLLRGNTSLLFWSIVSGFFGLSFGALCSLPYLLSGGFAAAFSYWVSGLLFDVFHCIGNAALCLLLFRPLYALMEYIFKYKKNGR